MSLSQYEQISLCCPCVAVLPYTVLDIIKVDFSTVEMLLKTFIPTSFFITRFSDHLQDMCVYTILYLISTKEGHCDFSPFFLFSDCLCLQVGSHRVKLSRGFEANAPAFER